MAKIVTAHSECIQDFIKLLKLEDKKVCEISFTIATDQVMHLHTKEYVGEDTFDEVINILRKYKVTEIPQEEK